MLCQIAAHVIPGLILIGLSYATRPYYCVLLMGLSSFLNGATVLTALQNSQDLSPNYTATIYGIINTI